MKVDNVKFALFFQQEYTLDVLLGIKKASIAGFNFNNIRFDLLNPQEKKIDYPSLASFILIRLPSL